MKTDDTRRHMTAILKTSTLAVVVVALHVLAIGGFFTIQGCDTLGEPKNVEPAPAPVMPPRITQEKKAPPPKRNMRRPAPVRPAPAMKVTSSAPATYIIQKGDSLGVIAQRHGVSSRELAEINGLKNPNMIRVGQKLILPPYAKKQKSAPRAKKKPVARKSVAKPSGKVAPGDVYVVQSGDVLSRIAVRHGTSLKELREVNKLSSDKIIVGQKLTIPGGVAPIKASPKAKTVTVAEPIRSVVSTPAPKVVKAAKPAPVVIEEERVEVDATVASPAPSVPEQAFYYSVIEGDSLEKVAMTFGLLKEELMKANNLSEDIELKANQRLIIPIP